MCKHIWKWKHWSYFMKEKFFEKWSKEIQEIPYCHIHLPQKLCLRWNCISFTPYIAVKSIDFRILYCKHLHKSNLIRQACRLHVIVKFNGIFQMHERDIVTADLTFLSAEAKWREGFAINMIETSTNKQGVRYKTPFTPSKRRRYR